MEAKTKRLRFCAQPVSRSRHHGVSRFPFGYDTNGTGMLVCHESIELGFSRIPKDDRVCKVIDTHWQIAQEYPVGFLPLRYSCGKLLFDLCNRIESDCDFKELRG